MRRIPAFLATATATLGLVLATSIPAHADTSASVRERRGDVYSNDGSALTRAERNIDTLGRIFFRTAEDRGRDYLLMRAEAKDFRGSGKQWMYLFVQRADDTGWTFVMANLDGSPAVVYPETGADPERCRGGRVRANLQRDVAVLRMPARCLNTGTETVLIRGAGTAFARRGSSASVTADDMLNYELGIRLDYR